MRFLFCDRIVEMELGRTAIGTRSISIGDEFLPDHYSRKPVIPATLMLEAVTQVAGWLYIATKQFGISTVLALAQGVDIRGEAGPGCTLQLEATMLLQHRDGATLRGVVTADGRALLEVERLVFASRPLVVAEDIQRSREMFYYISGGYQLDGIAQS